MISKLDSIEYDYNQIEYNINYYQGQNNNLYNLIIQFKIIKSFITNTLKDNDLEIDIKKQYMIKILSLCKTIEIKSDDNYGFLDRKLLRIRNYIIKECYDYENKIRANKLKRILK